MLFAPNMAICVSASAYFKVTLEDVVRKATTQIARYIDNTSAHRSGKLACVCHAIRDGKGFQTCVILDKKRRGEQQNECADNSLRVLDCRRRRGSSIGPASRCPEPARGTRDLFRNPVGPRISRLNVGDDLSLKSNG